MSIRLCTILLIFMTMSQAAWADPVARCRPYDVAHDNAIKVSVGDIQLKGGPIKQLLFNFKNSRYSDSSLCYAVAGLGSDTKMSRPSRVTVGRNRSIKLNALDRNFLASLNMAIWVYVPATHSINCSRQVWRHAPAQVAYVMDFNCRTRELPKPEPKSKKKK